MTRLPAIVAVLGCAGLASLLLAIAVGSVALTPAEVWAGLRGEGCRCTTPWFGNCACPAPWPPSPPAACWRWPGR